MIFLADTGDIHMGKIKIIDDLERIPSFSLKIAWSVSVRVYNYFHIVIGRFFPKRDPWVEWKWIIPEKLPEVIVDFKRAMYVDLLKIIKKFTD